MKSNLIIFSPLPPAKSGIADYVFEQLVILNKIFEVTVVVDSRSSKQAKISDVKIISKNEYEKNAREYINYPHIYHIGNNPHHEFVFEKALTKPGIVVLHDFVLHHLIAHITLGRGDVERYSEFLEYSYGYTGKTIAQNRQIGAFTENQQFLLPLNEKLFANSLGVITHSQFNKRLICARWKTLPVKTIPHHFVSKEVSKSKLEELKRKLKIEPGVLVFSSLGFATPPKQIKLIVKALANLKDKLPKFVFLVVGEEHPHSGISEAIKEHGLEHDCLVTGYLDEDEFDQYIAVSDLIFNLRYPSAGETSGTLVRALGHGKNVIIFDYETFSDYPDDIVWKIPLEVADTTLLEQAVVEFSVNIEKRTFISKNSMKLIKEKFDINLCINEYKDFINLLRSKDAASKHSPNKSSYSMIYKNGVLKMDDKKLEVLVNTYIDLQSKFVEEPELVDYLAQHKKRWAQSLSFVPVGDEAMTAVELGGYCVILPILKEVFGYGTVVGTDYEVSKEPSFKIKQLAGVEGVIDFDFRYFNLETEKYPFESNSVDLVLAWEVLEHMSMDPAYLIGNINRMLKMGGTLILTTPNISSAVGIEKILLGYNPQVYFEFIRTKSTNRHNHEYSPHTLSAFIRKMGFELKTVTTIDSWSEQPQHIIKLLEKNNFPTQLRGDNLVIVATKQSNNIQRFPEDIYGSGEVAFMSSKQL